MDGRTYAHQLEELLDLYNDLPARSRRGERVVDAVDVRLRILELKLTRLISIVERETGKKMEGSRK